MDEQTKQGLIYTMRLLSISKKSEARVREKLKEKGYSDSSIENVVRELKNQKILDDSKLAEEKVYWAKHGAPLGKRRLRFELKKQGLSEQTVQEALNHISTKEEKESAFSLAKTRFEKFKALDPLHRKKKLYDYLIRRGFDYEICREVVAKLNGHDEDN